MYFWHSFLRYKYLLMVKMNGFRSDVTDVSTNFGFTDALVINAALDIMLWDESLNAPLNVRIFLPSRITRTSPGILL